jgi:hypothetical protein
MDHDHCDLPSVSPRLLRREAMNRRIVVVCSAFALVGLLVAMAIVGPAFAQKAVTQASHVGGPTLENDPFGGGIGRYQGGVDGTNLWLFDTVTGKVWIGHLNGEWQEAVGPLHR